MSRVTCLECGFAVVVDPTGVCPEGHPVGGAGVDTADAMGTGSPHPGGEERDEAATHESMLHELHTLGDDDGDDGDDDDDDGDGDPTAPTGTGAADAPRLLPSPEQAVEGFAELSALEAAFQALGYEEGSIHPAEPPTDTGPTPVPAADATAEVAPRDDPGQLEDLSDLEDLFAPPLPHAPVAHAPGGIGAPATASSPEAPPTPPATERPQPAQSEAPDDAPPAAEDGAVRVDDPPRASEVGLDISNFTAKGGRVGAGRGGRLRRFGR